MSSSAEITVIRLVKTSLRNRHTVHDVDVVQYCREKPCRSFWYDYIVKTPGTNTFDLFVTEICRAEHKPGYTCTPGLPSVSRSKTSGALFLTCFVSNHGFYICRWGHNLKVFSFKRILTEFLEHQLLPSFAKWLPCRNTNYQRLWHHWKRTFQHLLMWVEKRRFFSSHFPSCKTVM